MAPFSQWIVSHDGSIAQWYVLTPCRRGVIVLDYPADLLFR